MQPYPFIGFSEPIASWSHLLAAVLALVMAFPLAYRGRGNSMRVVGLVIFSFSFVFLFSMSGVYHLLPHGTAKEVLRRLDHAGIWVMIAGSFTPIHLVLFRGFWRWGFLALIWGMAITGLVLKTVFFHDLPEWLGISLYLSLGWMGAFSAWKIASKYGLRRIRWFLLGSFAYTAGAIVELFGQPVLLPRIFEAHELFHIFVMLGASYHWLWVWSEAHIPFLDNLKFEVKQRPGPKFHALALGEFIEAEADSKEDLLAAIRSKVDSKYQDLHPPHNICLNYQKEELL